MSKTSTLQDVARVAGVSTATVSRTLSNPNVVSESTRKRVAEAVKVSGYRVNRAARNLRTQRSQSILVLLPDLGNPFFSTILEGISSHLAPKGYSMLIASTSQIKNTGERLIDYLDDVRADGIIILDGGLPDDVVKSLEQGQSSRTIIYACEWTEAGEFPSVRSENRRGTQTAVRYLHELGHRKIAHVTGPEDNVLTHARKEAFEAEIAALNLENPSEWIMSGDFNLEAGCKTAQDWIAMKNRPTAVFCASDMLALGFISELSRNGIKVPEDVSVMGFDDVVLAGQFIPPLTTIRQDRTQLGERAASILLSTLDNDNQEDGLCKVVIPVSLVERQSTAAPKL
ncbi:LacI family DNA-binding transcriptional regulator [Planktotalea sp.]|uniref:LacI family DNA-binding transcriptional regulator n=1 Tax=Planktotalea sp. TaxID=2029877 RepID=UPI0032979C9C